MGFFIFATFKIKLYELNPMLKAKNS